MNDNLKISSPRRQLGLYIFLLLAGWLLALAISLPVVIAAGGLKDGGAGINFDHPGSIALLKFLQAISTVAIFLVPAWLFSFYVFRDRPFYHLGFRQPPGISFYILAIALLLLSFPLDAWLGQLNRSISLPLWMIDREKEANRQIIAFLKTGSTMGVLVNVFVIALLPAICEEACFRGALQPILIRLFRSPFAGILVTAIFFSAFHMQFQGFLPRLLLGLLLGAAYWYSGSLLVAIVAHFFTNAVQVVAVAYYPKYMTEDPSVPFYWAIISMIIVITILANMRGRSETNIPGNVDAKEFH
jgi:membrane protease YdiL (CAAX protease family)